MVLLFIVSTSRQVLKLLFDVMAVMAHKHQAFGFGAFEGGERYSKMVLYRHHLLCEH